MCQHFSRGCKANGLAAVFEAALASSSSGFAAAVPPLKDEKLSRAKLREPPTISAGAQLEARFRSASRLEVTRPGKISRSARPASAAGSRQVRVTCTNSLFGNFKEIPPSASRLLSGTAAGLKVLHEIILFPFSFNTGQCIPQGTVKKPQVPPAYSSPMWKLARHRNFLFRKIPSPSRRANRPAFPTHRHCPEQH